MYFYMYILYIIGQQIGLLKKYQSNIQRFFIQHWLIRCTNT